MANSSPDPALWPLDAVLTNRRQAFPVPFFGVNFVAIMSLD
jgi:hypothetical protein